MVVVVEDGGRALPGGPAVPEGGGVRGMRNGRRCSAARSPPGRANHTGWRVTARLPLDGTPVTARTSPGSAAGQEREGTHCR